MFTLQRYIEMGGDIDIDYSCFFSKFESGTMNQETYRKLD
jgi:hypothetical protein